MKLSTPRFAVIYTDSTGDEVAVEVQSTQSDVVRYDLLRGRNGWPAVTEAPMLWTTVVAWAALVRLGHDVPADWKSALDRILSVDTLNGRGELAVEGDEVGVNPTHGTA